MSRSGVTRRIDPIGSATGETTEPTDETQVFSKSGEVNIAALRKVVSRVAGNPALHTDMLLRARRERDRLKRTRVLERVSARRTHEPRMPVRRTAERRASRKVSTSRRSGSSRATARGGDGSGGDDPPHPLAVRFERPEPRLDEVALAEVDDRLGVAR